MKVKISRSGKNCFSIKESSITYEEGESFDQFIRMISSYNNLAHEWDGRIHPVKFRCFYDKKKREIEIAPASSPLFCGLFIVRSNSIDEAYKDFKRMCRENNIKISRNDMNCDLEDERKALIKKCD